MATQVIDKTTGANAYISKILYTGTQAAIDAATKVETGLYFATDTKKLYKGTVDFTEHARFVTEMPQTPVKSALYIVTTAQGAFVKAVATNASGTAVEIAWAKVTTIDTNSTDNQVPTALAVKTYVDNAVGGGTVVHSVDASDTTGGVIVIDDGLTGEETVTVPGVALKPTWDSSTRTLTIPYTELGSTASGSVTMNLGLDAVVNYGRYNATEEQLEFWLTTHPYADYPSDPSFVVPVGDLIDELQVSDTNTVDMTYTASTNTVSADVKISAKTGNGLSVLTTETTASHNGLYVDLSDYALATDLADVVTDVAQLDDNMDALYTAVTSWTTLTAPAQGE